MTFSILSNQKFLVFALISIIISSCCYYSGYADDNPAEMFTKALFCFNNKFIYSGCDEAYRLNESGNINVPMEATDSFCNGPCFQETTYMLNCVDREISDFIFRNKATIPDIRTVLNRGCSFTSQRGIFDMGRYFEGETSNGEKLIKFNSFYAVFVILTGSFFLMF